MRRDRKKKLWGAKKGASSVSLRSSLLGEKLGALSSGTLSSPSPELPKLKKVSPALFCPVVAAALPFPLPDPCPALPCIVLFCRLPCPILLPLQLQLPPGPENVLTPPLHCPYHCPYLSS